MNKTFKADYRRLVGEPWGFMGPVRVLRYYSLRFECWGRAAQHARTGLTKRFFTWLQRRCGRKYGLEMNFDNIGPGLILGHPFGITINPEAVVGECLTIFKGATVGSVVSGRRAGVPVLGDRVTVCCNAFVCGGIRVGSDVLIAANAFVDFDVPDHSLVFGNPGVLRHKERASADYQKL